MLPIDREKAEEAKQKANEQSTRPYDIVSYLCPACNQPVTYGEPDPNEYVHGEDSDGELTVDRAAFEFSPARLMGMEHENPWDAVHVVPEEVEFDSGTYLRVTAYKHDYSTEGYEAWERELEKLNDVEKRAEENQGLGDFA